MLARWTRPLILALLTACLGTASIAFAWTGPTGAPPGNNIAAPINTGSASQIKDGTLGVGGLYVFGQAVIAGDITARGYFHTSDARLKTDITPIADARSVLSRLRGVHFTWRDTDRPSFGFLAQDLEAVLPETVITDAAGWKAVDTDQLIPVLVEALNEQEQEIRALRHAIDRLSSHP